MIELKMDEKEILAACAEWIQRKTALPVDGNLRLEWEPDGSGGQDAVIWAPMGTWVQE